MRDRSGMLALALALAACEGGGGDGGGAAGSGGAGGGRPPPPAATATPRGERVDCTYFDRPDGCWQQLLAHIEGCRPGLAEGVPIEEQTDAVGTLDESRRLCTYTNGVRVELRDPLPDIYGLDEFELLEAFGDYVYRFTVFDAGGAECLRFDDDEKPFTVHLPSGDFRFEYFNLLDLDTAFAQIACPDGTEVWLPFAETSKCAPHAPFGRFGSYHQHGLTLGFNDDQITNWTCYAPPP